MYIMSPGPISMAYFINPSHQSVFVCVYTFSLLANISVWAGHVARMGEKRNAYRILVGNPEGKRPLGRPRRRWEDNIKMDL
jgi:hypothetical protein